VSGADNQQERLSVASLPSDLGSFLVGTKANDFELFASAVTLLAKDEMSDSDYRQVLLLREQMNRWRQAPLHGRENPQRLYAELAGLTWAGEMR
jgi:hypothetical protein